MVNYKQQYGHEDCHDSDGQRKTTPKSIAYPEEIVHAPKAGDERDGKKNRGNLVESLSLLVAGAVLAEGNVLVKFADLPVEVLHIFRKPQRILKHRVNLDALVLSRDLAKINLIDEADIFTI